MNKKNDKKITRLANLIGATVFAILGKEDDITYDIAMNAIAKAREIVDDKMNTIKEKLDSKQDADHSDHDVLGAACKKINKLFRQAAKIEQQLAKAEHRDVNFDYLKRIAKRITRSVLKDTPGVKVDDIAVEVKRNENGGVTLEVTITDY